MYRVMGERPNIQRLVRHFTEATMARVLQSVACNALHTVEARSCRFILTIHYRIDRDKLALTHEFLAERLGVQRTTVSAVMLKLQARGLIRQAKGGITVTDPVGLEAEACECYGRVIRDVLEDLLPDLLHPLIAHPTWNRSSPPRWAVASDRRETATALGSTAGPTTMSGNGDLMTSYS